MLNNRRSTAATVLALTGLLALCLTALPAGASYPGRNGRIVFASGAAIVSRAVGGTTTKTLVPSMGREASFSANGNKIVYGKYSVGPYSWDIWTMNADGTGKRNVTKGEDRYFTPTFSPSGGKIMYGVCCSASAESRLFTINADGTGKREFAPKVGGSMAAGVWSPNGARVAYAGGPGFDPQTLRTIKATGEPGSVKVLTTRVKNVESADWAPDGRRLVFTSMTPMGYRTIHRINADGTGLRKLADFSGVEGSADRPVWAPDGTKILFDKQVGAGETQLWLMNPDGSSKRKIANKGYDATWQPRP